MKMKYIHFDNVGGIPDMIVIFPECLKHDFMARRLAPPNMENNPADNVISAGFVSIQDERASCFGESTSLKKKSAPEDTHMLHLMLKGC